MTDNTRPLTLPSTFHRLGLGYLGTTDPGEITLIADRLKDRSLEVHGELRVLIGGQQIFCGSHNFSGIQSRSTCAKYLAGRSSIPLDLWTTAVEEFCSAVITADREGEPLLSLNGTGRRPPGEDLLLGPLLPLDKPTLIYAPGGTGKTTLAAAIALSLETGVPIIPGFLPARHVTSLILDWESSVDDWRDILDGICEGVGIKRPVMNYRACRRPLHDDAHAIAQLVSQVGAQLVIVDSVGLASGSGRDNGDANESTLRLFSALRLLGVTSLLLDHVVATDLSLDRSGKPDSKPYGSVYKINLSRQAFELRAGEPDAGNIPLILRNVKVNRGPRAAPIGLTIHHSPDGIIRCSRGAVEAPDLVATLPTAERMRRLLGARGALNTADIAEELDIPPQSVRVALSRDQGRTFTRLHDRRIGLASF